MLFGGLHWAIAPHKKEPTLVTAWLFCLKAKTTYLRALFVIECHGFGFFCLEPLKTI